jgi:hypothetical protein
MQAARLMFCLLAAAIVLWPQVEAETVKEQLCQQLACTGTHQGKTEGMGLPCDCELNSGNPATCVGTIDKLAECEKETGTGKCKGKVKGSEGQGIPCYTEHPACKSKTPGGG